MARLIRIVDVFTEKALAGNQLAVVLDGEGLSRDHMQKIAREMNFSETTFILRPDDPANAARVRIFTPAQELKFAGHPTIGSAWVLFDEGVATGDELVLEEGVGPVAVRRDGEMLWMTHPPVEFGEVFPHARVTEALGLDEPAAVADVPAQVVSTGNPFLFIALTGKRAVDDAESDRQRLGRLLDGHDAHGVFLFASTGTGRLYSRMVGIDGSEDPATGSACGPLGAYAVRYGLVEPAPRVSIVSEQGTKMGRQSFVHIELVYGTADVPTRIEVGGHVAPVLSGALSDFS